MTTQLSGVDVANMALSQIAARTAITSVTVSDGTKAGDAVVLLYQPTVDAFARAAHWNCLRFTAQLTLLKAAAGTAENPSGTTLPVPPQPWLYEYALPADCFKARFIVPQLTQQDCFKARFIVPQLTQQPTSPPLTTGASQFLPARLGNVAIPFTPAVDLDQNKNEIAVLLTNIGTALTGPPSLVYTKRLTNVGLWDSQFLMGAKSALATWLVNPINASAAMMGQAMGIAKAMLDAARVSDGNEGPQSEDHVPDWIAARGGGRRRPSGLFIGAWDPFGFPNGVFY